MRGAMAGVTPVELDAGPVWLLIRAGWDVALLAGQFRVFTCEGEAGTGVIELRNRIPADGSVAGLAVGAELSLVRLPVTVGTLAIETEEGKAEILHLYG